MNHLVSWIRLQNPKISPRKYNPDLQQSHKQNQPLYTHDLSMVKHHKSIGHTAQRALAHEPSNLIKGISPSLADLLSSLERASG